MPSLPLLPPPPLSHQQHAESQPLAYLPGPCLGNDTVSALPPTSRMPPRMLLWLLL